jgi:glycosyltransferase involved in cell wall biosynthesis
MVEPGKNGLLVAPADQTQLAEACVRLLRTPDEALRLGQGGQDVAETRFNVRNQVRKLENIYQELLERTNSS